MRGFGTFVAGCAIAAWGVAAGATVIVPADLGELSHDARAIARGRVVAVDGRWTDDRRTIETIVTLEVALPERRPRSDAPVPRARRRARALPQHRRRRAGVSGRSAGGGVSRRVGTDDSVHRRIQSGRLPRRARPLE